MNTHRWHDTCGPQVARRGSPRCSQRQDRRGTGTSHTNAGSYAQLHCRCIPVYGSGCVQSHVNTCLLTLAGSTLCANLPIVFWAHAAQLCRVVADLPASFHRKDPPLKTRSLNRPTRQGRGLEVPKHWR